MPFHCPSRLQLKTRIVEFTESEFMTTPYRTGNVKEVWEPITGEGSMQEEREKKMNLCVAIAVFIYESIIHTGCRS